MNFEWSQASFYDDRTWKELYKKKGSTRHFIGIVKLYALRALVVSKVRAYDFVFLHREMAPLGPPLLEWFLAKILRKKIIYDFDDAIWLPDPNETNRLWRFLKWKSKVKWICRWSWKVSVGNEFLASYARKYNSHVFILPTVIDKDFHVPASSSSPSELVKLGWTGSHSTLTYLDLLFPILQKVNKQLPFEMVVIANHNPQLDLENYTFVPWKKETEIQDLQQIEIGLMPLSDDDWSKGKCGFKAIQYGALAIPALVSPVGVNTQVVIHEKTGFHCKDEGDWEEFLIDLISDQNLRHRLGKNGRKHIEQHYSSKAIESEFLSLFQP